MTSARQTSPAARTLNVPIWPCRPVRRRPASPSASPSACHPAGQSSSSHNQRDNRLVRRETEIHRSLRAHTFSPHVRMRLLRARLLVKGPSSEAQEWWIRQTPGIAARAVGHRWRLGVRTRHPSRRHHPAPAKGHPRLTRDLLGAGGNIVGTVNCRPRRPRRYRPLVASGISRAARWLSPTRCCRKT